MNKRYDLNLFAGAGGLATGLTRAGFHFRYLYERDRDSCMTLASNRLLKDSEVVCTDVTTVKWGRHRQRVRLLAAGVPCQPFSWAGCHRGQDDKRNLFPSILRIIQTVKPKAFIIENVEGIINPTSRTYLDYLILALMYGTTMMVKDTNWKREYADLKHYKDQHRGYTYQVTSQVINAADYGVPQHRKRIFLIGVDAQCPRFLLPPPTHSRYSLIASKRSGAYWRRHGLKPRPEFYSAQLSFPNGTKPWVTVRDAIDGLGPPGTNKFTHHDAIAGAKLYEGHTGSQLDWIAKTIKAGVHGTPGGENMLVSHDSAPRYFTLRELARLQSFPDIYSFHGSRSSIVRQLGNAVPCKLAQRLGSALRECL